MILEAASLAVLAAQFAYHRWWEDKPLEKIKPQEVSIPRTDQGTPVPIIIGRTKVRGPILVWQQKPVREAGNIINGWPVGTSFFRMNMFFVVGVGFRGGNTRVHALWAGDRMFGPGKFNVARETPMFVEISQSTPGSDAGPIGTQLMYYDGNAAQDVGAGLAGSLMIDAGVDVFQIPSYFDCLSVVLYDNLGLCIRGSSSSVASYAFEAASYPPAGPFLQVGPDANPASAIYFLLTDDLVGLGVSPSLIDLPSFQSCGAVLSSESHGYSICIDAAKADAGHIIDILKQIDGTIDIDHKTGKLKMKLVRGDFDPSAPDFPHITKDNCEKLTNVTFGGWPDAISSVRVVYENRDKDYADDSEPEFNQAQEVDDELVLEFRGAKHSSLAKSLARRELNARSRPMIKCRALVSREFARLMRGDAVKVTYKGISGLIFRVVDIDRGTLADGLIALDLISDYFYVYRNETPTRPWDFGIDIPPDDLPQIEEV